MEEDGTFEVLPKKEVALLNKQRARLEKFLGGSPVSKSSTQPTVVDVVPHAASVAITIVTNKNLICFISSFTLKYK